MERGGRTLDNVGQKRRKYERFKYKTNSLLWHVVTHGGDCRICRTDRTSLDCGAANTINEVRFPAAGTGLSYPPSGLLELSFHS